MPTALRSYRWRSLAIALGLLLASSIPGIAQPQRAKQNIRPSVQPPAAGLAELPSVVGVRKCEVNEVSIKGVAVKAAGGKSEVQVTMTSTSSDPCVLEGRPDVELLDKTKQMWTRPSDDLLIYGNRTAPLPTNDVVVSVQIQAECDSGDPSKAQLLEELRIALPGRQLIAKVEDAYGNPTCPIEVSPFYTPIVSTPASTLPLSAKLIVPAEVASGSTLELHPRFD